VELLKVVPWGRELSGYKAMFSLSDNDLRKHIRGCGDGQPVLMPNYRKMANLVYSQVKKLNFSLEFIGLLKFKLLKEP